MSIATDQSYQAGMPRTANAWESLPITMRVLAVVGSERHAGWLDEVFAYEKGSHVELSEAVGIVEGLARLRDDPFDAVLISHEPGELDALSTLDAIRTGSSEDQPVIVLGEIPETELGPLCLEAGADAYLRLESTTARMLLWHVARARERQRLLAENRQLVREKRNQLQKEKTEATRYLTQQKQLLDALPNKALPSLSTSVQSTLQRRYYELLQAYVIMGGGSLAGETARLATHFAGIGLRGRSLLELHVDVVELAIQELGSRSARHVVQRANALFMELAVRLDMR